jgi:Ni,Fe-hydrogenase III large subunit
MLHSRSEITYDGDRIKAVKIHWGSENRPLWQALDNMPLRVAIKWVDRFCPFEAVSAEWALAGTVEKAYHIQVPERANFLRTIYAEVQRLAWSFNYLVRIFKAMDDSIRTQQFLRLREQVFEGQEFLTGSRILPQIFCIGGIDRDLSIGERKKLKSLVRNIEYELRLYFKDLSGDQLFLQRMMGLLPISKAMASRLALFGPLGQASGIQRDIRLQAPYGIYPQCGIRCFDTKSTTDWFEGKTFFDLQGDGVTRVRSVLFQMRQALQVLDFCLERIVDGPVRIDVEQNLAFPEGFWSTGVESGSGPLYGMVCENRLRVVSHSMRMVGMLEKLAVDLYVDDYELAVASLGVEFGQSDLCGNY